MKKKFNGLDYEYGKYKENGWSREHSLYGDLYIQSDSSYAYVDESNDFHSTCLDRPKDFKLTSSVVHNGEVVFKNETSSSFFCGEPTPEARELFHEIESRMKADTAKDRVRVIEVGGMFMVQKKIELQGELIWSDTEFVYRDLGSAKDRRERLSVCSGPNPKVVYP